MQNAPAMHVMMLLGECYDASLLHFQRKHYLVCASDFKPSAGNGAAGGLYFKIEPSVQLGAERKERPDAACVAWC
jgi:glycerate kinase